MSYAQKRELSGNRTMSIIFTAIVVGGLMYAIVTGLAYNVVKKATENLKVVDVEEPPPPPEKPPPPPRHAGRSAAADDSAAAGASQHASAADRGRGEPQHSAGRASRHGAAEAAHHRPRRARRNRAALPAIFRA